MFPKALIIATLMALPLTAQAQDSPRATSTVADQESIAITIYNENLGLVKDVRNITLPRGTVDLWFQGVAAQIDRTSVAITSLSAARDLRVLEQNFEYDLISPERLMQKYIGREVELVQWRDDEEVVVKARLIGNQGGYVYEIDGKIAINPHGRVVLPELPDGLISEPSLVWLLENKRDKHRVQASYLTGGLSWKADYVAILNKDDNELDLSGWVSIDNRSGTTYENATLKLVAGDVNRVQDQRIVPHAALAMVETSDARQFQEESFFEYHLYTLERPATVRDQQTKQISLLNATDIGAKKTFVYESGNRWWFSRYDGIDKTGKVGVYLAFDNSENNRLGMPLPRGVVRVYKEDASGSLQFVGEDRIDHTPRDERVRVRMGNAFDVVAERVQTEFSVLSSGHLYRSSYKITLRNHKDDDIVVNVIETVPGDWTVTKESLEHVKESASRIRFDVPVASRGETELTYTVEIRY